MINHCFTFCEAFKNYNKGGPKITLFQICTLFCVNFFLESLIDAEIMFQGMSMLLNLSKYRFTYSLQCLGRKYPSAVGLCWIVTCPIYHEFFGAPCSACINIRNKILGMPFLIEGCTF